MNSRISLVIFDLDGTILNTLNDLADSVNFALLKNNLAPRTIEEVRRFVGNGIRNLMVRSVCAAKQVSVIEGTTCVPDFAESASEAEKSTFFSLIDSVHADFTAHYKMHCADKTRPYDGIPELLQHLRSRGIKTAVVSNKADYGVQTLCANYFPNLFDFAVGEREGIKRKPAPDIIFAVMEKFSADKNETIYIGDSDVDIETARNAGITCISVSWGFRSEAFLREHGASVIVKNSEELLHFFEAR